MSSRVTGCQFFCNLHFIPLSFNYIGTCLLPFSSSHNLSHGSNLRFFHSPLSLVPSISAGPADLPTCSSVSCQHDCWTSQGHDVWTSLSLLACVFPFSVLLDTCVHVMFLNVCVYSMFDFWSFCSQNSQHV